MLKGDLSSLLMDAVINTSSSLAGRGTRGNTRISPFLWSPWERSIIVEAEFKSYGERIRVLWSCCRLQRPQLQFTEQQRLEEAALAGHGARNGFWEEMGFNKRR